ncbi:MAG: hypothetical protein ACREH4_07045 [Vitreimonas sp.]
MSVVAVISHPRPARKRRRIFAYALRRLGALAITLAALTAVTWIAPRLTPSSPPAGTGDITLTAKPLPAP